MLLTLLSLCVVQQLVAPAATAAVNTQANFQGRLADSAGLAVADETYAVEFKLHNDGALTGGAQGACSASCLWIETRTVVAAIGI